MRKKMKKKYKKKDSKRYFHGGIKDHYTIVCHYNDARSYTPFYGTGEQLKKFVLKIRKEKYESKLPKRVSIELMVDKIPKV
jgi:hypothetical protein